MTEPPRPRQEERNDEEEKIEQKMMNWSLRIQFLEIRLERERVPQNLELFAAEMNNGNFIVQEDKIKAKTFLISAPRARPKGNKKLIRTQEKVSHRLEWLTFGERQLLNRKWGFCTRLFTMYNSSHKHRQLATYPPNAEFGLRCYFRRQENKIVSTDIHFLLHKNSLKANAARISMQRPICSNWVQKLLVFRTETTVATIKIYTLVRLINQ